MWLYLKIGSLQKWLDLEMTSSDNDGVFIGGGEDTQGWRFCEDRWRSEWCSCQPRALRLTGRTEAGRWQEGFFPGTCRQSMALPTLITDIWLPEPWENKFLLFQATKFVLYFFFFNGNPGQIRHLLLWAKRRTRNSSAASSCRANAPLHHPER